ncbi:MAG TPA: VWA domain-containing protein [Spirochaetia bacterium]|nr:VWA domain-containing protein [Spirochaetia bacterium]
MNFIWANMLWLLALVPVLAGAYVLAQRRRQKYALRYASLSLVQDALGKGPGIRRHIPAALFLVGLAVMIIALARPSATITLPSEQGTVMLSMDVSGSMRATDIKPSRMEAVKEAARIFINKRPRHVRIGLVAFSGTAELIQPPTTDNDQLLAAVNRLHPERYTAIGSGIQTALDAIFEKLDQTQTDANAQTPSPTDPLAAAPPDQQEPPPVPPGSYTSAVIVLLTDGQSNQGPNPLDVADKAANLGVRVYTVGVGTKEGAIIGFEGFSFRVILDEATLKQIAAKTAGQYYKASSEGDLHRIYDNLSTRLMVEREKTEITALFVAAAAVLLLAAGAFSLIWFNRLP